MNKKLMFVSSVAWVCGALFGAQVTKHIWEERARHETVVLEETVRALRKQILNTDNSRGDISEDQIVDEKKDYDEIVKRQVPTNPNEEMKNSIDISALRHDSKAPNIERPKSKKTPKIEVLRFEDFLDKPDGGWEEDEFSYWFEDNTLSDDHDEVIIDEARLIGDQWFDHFDEDPDNPDSVYIRNYDLRTDFIVNRKLMSYAEVVLGIEREE